MVICGNIATDTERLCESTSTQKVDIGLLRMILSLTNGKAETITTADISTAFLNAPMDETKVVLTSPQVWLTLGIVKPGTIWKIRKAVY
eukprot:12914316-Prorocentrum_lima.AAC.1